MRVGHAAAFLSLIAAPIINSGPRTRECVLDPHWFKFISHWNVICSTCRTAWMVKMFLTGRKSARIESVDTRPWIAYVDRHRHCLKRPSFQLQHNRRCLYRSIMSSACSLPVHAWTEQKVKWEQTFSWSAKVCGRLPHVFAVWWLHPRLGMCNWASKLVHALSFLTRVYNF